MPITYQTEQGGNFLRVIADGELTFAEMRSTHDRIVADPELRGVTRVLVDLRSVSRFAFAANELLSLARSHGMLPFARPCARIAFVAPAGVAFGLARMYEISRQPENDLVMVFTQEAPAVRWLAE